MISVLRGMALRVPEIVQLIVLDGIRMFRYQDDIVSATVQSVRDIAETCVSIALSRT